MTENTSQAETLAPTVRLVRHPGSGQLSRAVPHVLANVSTTMTCRYARALDHPAAGDVGPA